MRHLCGRRQPLELAQEGYNCIIWCLSSCLEKHPYWSPEWPHLFTSQQQWVQVPLIQCVWSSSCRVRDFLPGYLSMLGKLRGTIKDRVLDCTTSNTNPTPPASIALGTQHHTAMDTEEWGREWSLSLAQHWTNSCQVALLLQWTSQGASASVEGHRLDKVDR